MRVTGKGLGTCLLGLALAAVACSADAQSSAASSAATAENAAGIAALDVLQEVVVTATRREENINTIPISVTALNSESLDQKGIVSIDDLTRMTPGVTFIRTAFADTSSISIRGIASSVGTSTTGIYIDDTPVQVRALNADSNLYPQNFDLARVEVLRGPQGTLFGAGSEGGTVRFITTAPGLKDYSGYVRADAGALNNGAPQGEVGVAYGGPIVQDKLGFRLSGWFGHDAGYVDRVSPFDGTTPIDSNSNSANNYAFRGALKFAPSEAVDMTASAYYQHEAKNNSSRYFERISNPSDGVWRAADPSGGPTADDWFLTDLNIKARLGDNFDLVSVTSYLNRRDAPKNDDSHFMPVLILGPQIWDNSLVLPIPVPPYTYTEQTFFLTKQNNIMQELRLQTTPATAPFTGTLGVFFMQNRQFSSQSLYDPTLEAFSETYLGGTVEQAFGAPFISPNQSYLATDDSKDRQAAVFGDLAYDIARGWKVAAGFRYEKASFDYQGVQYGPWIGPEVLHVNGSQTAHPFDPRFYVSYQPNSQNMFYASASKGFRIGGANKPVPVAGDPCREALAQIGYTNTPPSYNPDSLWSYEIGAKNGFLDGRMQVNSSLYYVRWKDIQQSVFVPACQFNFVSNLGNAISEGGDISIDMLVTPSLELSLGAAYTNAYYSSSVTAGSNVQIVSEGDGLPTTPWHINATLNYRFHAFGLPSFATFVYSYDSHLSRLTPQTNPANQGYDPVNINPEAVSFASVRIGANVRDSLELSLYCDNLFNVHPIINQSDDSPGSKLIYATTITPLSFGMRATYRF